VNVTTGHTEKIYCVHFHPLASGVLVSASYDMTVRVWDIDSEEQRIVLQGHSDTVSLLLIEATVAVWQNIMNDAADLVICMYRALLPLHNQFLCFMSA